MGQLLLKCCLEFRWLVFAGFCLSSLHTACAIRYFPPLLILSKTQLAQLAISSKCWWSCRLGLPLSRWHLYREWDLRQELAGGQGKDGVTLGFCQFEGIFWPLVEQPMTAHHLLGPLPSNRKKLGRLARSGHCQGRFQRVPSVFHMQAITQPLHHPPAPVPQARIIHSFQRPRPTCTSHHGF